MRLRSGWHLSQQDYDARDDKIDDGRIDTLRDACAGGLQKAG
jgi:hypothetical protein